jgi:hypothetical protein
MAESTSKAAVEPLEGESKAAGSSGAEVTDRGPALELSGGNAGAEGRPADTNAAAVAPPVDKQTNVPIAPGAQTPTGNTDKAEAEGCKPIGVTARGQLVFPMQCRAELEHQQGLTTEIRPSAEKSAPVQADSLASTAPPSRETPTRSEPARPLAGGTPDLPPATSTAAEKKKPDTRPEMASRAETKPASEKTEQDRQATRETRGESPKPRQASRSKPVMMILRTVEFPDGHREQRLLPLNRTRRIASQSEEPWFSPLSYR